MLVLTRRVGEEIVIGPDIRLTVTHIQGDRVRIGISAPKHVRVDRDEVAQRRRELAAGPSGHVLAGAHELVQRSADRHRARTLFDR